METSEAEKEGVMSQWRTDFEQAPKDGTIILVALTVRGDDTPTVYEARWNEVSGCFSARNGFLLFEGATHWMPLPPPPNRKDEDRWNGNRSKTRR